MSAAFRLPRNRAVLLGVVMAVVLTLVALWVVTAVWANQLPEGTAGAIWGAGPIGWALGDAYVPTPHVSAKANKNFLKLSISPYLAKDIALGVRNWSPFLNSLLSTAAFTLIYVGARLETQGTSLVLQAIQATLYSISPALFITTSLVKLDIRSLWVIRAAGSYSRYVIHKFLFSAVLSFLVASAGLIIVVALFGGNSAFLFLSALGASGLATALCLTGTLYSRQTGMFDSSRPDFAVLTAVAVVSGAYLLTTLYAVNKPVPLLVLAQILPFWTVVVTVLLGLSVQFLRATDF